MLFEKNYLSKEIASQLYGYYDYLQSLDHGNIDYNQVDEKLNEYLKYFVAINNKQSAQNTLKYDSINGKIENFDIVLNQVPDSNALHFSDESIITIWTIKAALAHMSILKIDKTYLDASETLPSFKNKNSLTDPIGMKFKSEMKEYENDPNLNQIVQRDKDKYGILRYIFMWIQSALHLDLINLILHVRSFYENRCCPKKNLERLKNIKLTRVFSMCRGSNCFKIINGWLEYLDEGDDIEDEQINEILCNLRTRLDLNDDAAMDVDMDFDDALDRRCFDFDNMSRSRSRSRERDRNRNRNHNRRPDHIDLT